ncbi:MAG: amidohydrolase family protein [Clostridiales bacterium]|nr:amidohydrolase family protein [Clostridiales bacterium]
MAKTIVKNLIFFILVLVIAPALVQADVSPTYALVNCRIVPVGGPQVEKGIIIIRDGLIESIGTIGIIKIPEDAEVIEAEGLTAYPGLISAHTNFFIEPPKEERPAAEALQTAESQPEKPVAKRGSPAFSLLKPKKTTIEALHRIGITTILAAAGSGIFAGQSVLINLNGEAVEPMVVKNPVALHINFATERGAYPSSLMGTMALLRQSFLDAAYYASHRTRFEQLGRGMKRPEYNPFLEDLVPYVVDKKPIIFTCANQEDIKRALRLRDEFKLNILISGANEAWRVADALRKTPVPLFISLDFRPPMSSEYSQKGEEEKRRAEKDIYPANAKALSQAGLPFALTSFGLSDPATIQKNIRAAIYAGLPADEALKAWTITPAKFLGVDSILGSLERGKIANIILTRGEIFDEKTEIEKVFVDGVFFPVEKKAAEAQPAAINVAGTWKAAVRSPMGELDLTMELEQEGSKVSGALTSAMGRWEIREGTLSGSNLVFSIEATIMGQTMTMEFSGTAEKDSLEGTISTAMGNAELRASRVPKTSP